jgi:hypothetical protein
MYSGQFWETPAAYMYQHGKRSSQFTHELRPDCRLDYLNRETYHSEEAVVAGIGIARVQGCMVTGGTLPGAVEVISHQVDEIQRTASQKMGEL